MDGDEKKEEVEIRLLNNRYIVADVCLIRPIEISDLVNNKYSVRTVIKNRIIAWCNNSPIYHTLFRETLETLGKAKLIY